MLCKLRHLAPSPQKVGAVAEAAAADRAARHEHLALKGHHPDFLLVFAGNLNGVVVLIHHQNASQKGSCNIPVLRRRPDQGVGKADDASLLQRPHHRKSLPAANGRKRQEGRTAGLFSFQKADHPLCGALVVRHDVLDAAAEGRLNGRLIFRLRFDQIRNNADEPRLTVLLLHHAFDAAAEALIPLCQIRQRIQPGFLLMVLRLGCSELLIRAGKDALAVGDLLLQGLLPFSEGRSLPRNLFEDSAQVLQIPIVLRLVAGGAHQLGGQLGFAQLVLLSAGVHRRHSGLDGASAVDGFQECRAFAVHFLIQPALLLLYGLERLLCRLSSPEGRASPGRCLPFPL